MNKIIIFSFLLSTTLFSCSKNAQVVTQNEVVPVKQTRQLPFIGFALNGANTSINQISTVGGATVITPLNIGGTNGLISNGTSDLLSVTGITLRNGRIWVLCRGVNNTNWEIWATNPTLATNTFTLQFTVTGLPAGINNLKDLEFDPTGNVFYTINNFTNVLRISPVSGFSSSIGTLAGAFTAGTTITSICVTQFALPTTNSLFFVGSNGTAIIAGRSSIATGVMGPITVVPLAGTLPASATPIDFGIDVAGTSTNFGLSFNNTHGIILGGINLTAIGTSTIPGVNSSFIDLATN
jgi:hypothetical protein